MSERCRRQDLTPATQEPATQEPPADAARRRLLASLAIAIGGSALLGRAPEARAATASQLPLLKDTDPSAQATQYVSDARRATAAKKGASCSNCSLYGSVSPTAGTCSLFPSNLVAAGGWCSAWSGL
jgi:hypothetical protein